jgi:hypothetical protein
LSNLAFVIHVADALAPNLNGYFWAIGDWNKKKGPTTIANTLYETFNGNGDIVTDYIKNN